MKSEAINEILPPQHRQPSIEPDRVPLPHGCLAGGKLQDQVALVSGGDSGVGRAVALAFAKEGADVAFIYLDQHGDATETARALRSLGREYLKIAVDIGDECLCQGAVDQVVSYFGKLDILVNNAAEQHPQEKLENLSEAQLLRTFQSNVFSMFYLTKAALPHLKRGARIINTASISGLPRQFAAVGLLRQPRCDRSLHALAVTGLGRARYSRERCRARACMRRRLATPRKSPASAWISLCDDPDCPMRSPAATYSSHPMIRAICPVRFSIRTGVRSSMA